MPEPRHPWRSGPIAGLPSPPWQLSASVRAARPAPGFPEPRPRDAGGEPTWGSPRLPCPPALGAPPEAAGGKAERSRPRPSWSRGQLGCAGDTACWPAWQVAHKMGRRGLRRGALSARWRDEDWLDSPSMAAGQCRRPAPLAGLSGGRHPENRGAC